jgi:hypothetical protein
MTSKPNIEILTNIFISFRKTIQQRTDREGEKTAALEMNPLIRSVDFIDQILMHLASAAKGLSCSL